MSRMLRSEPHPDARIRVAIADASGLLYSDDYRSGWTAGFRGIGCDVQVFDVGLLGRMPTIRSGPYSLGAQGKIAGMVAKNIVAWNPDLVFCHHGRAASQQGFLAELNKRGIRTAVYLCDEPYECGETVKYSPHFDFVFTMDPCTVHLHSMARRGQRVFYLPPGVDTGHFKLRSYDKRGQGRDHCPDAVFLGNAQLVPRPKYLRPIEEAIPGAEIRYWKTVNKHMQDWIPLADHPKLYSRCKLGLNVHRHPGITEKCFKTRVLNKRNRAPSLGTVKPVEVMLPEQGTGFWNDYNLPAAHINPRFLEMAACGTCVINDNERSELARMFPEVPRADSPEEFVELALYYLDHLDQAQEIGRECHRKICERHTYQHRAAEILLRVGLRASTRAREFSSLGEPKDWLTTQDLEDLQINPLSGPIGRCEPFDPRTGIARMRGSGVPKSGASLRTVHPWSR